MEEETGKSVQGIFKATGEAKGMGWLFKSLRRELKKGTDKEVEIRSQWGMESTGTDEIIL